MIQLNTDMLLACVAKLNEAIISAPGNDLLKIQYFFD